MKNFLMGFAAFTLVLSSCSQNDVVETIDQNNGAIKFGAIAGNLSSRASEATMADLEAAGVDLFALITKGEGQPYTKYFEDKLTLADGVWSTTTTRYLKEGYKNEFYSIFPAQSGIDADKLAADGPKFAFTVGAAADVDLLGAAATGDYKPSVVGVAVTMPFYHLLSQANFGITGVPTLCRIDIKNTITFKAVGATGTYTLGGEAIGGNNWTAPTYGDFVMKSGLDTKDLAPDADGHYILDRAANSLMLVPAAFNSSSITFTFQAYDSAGVEITNGETVGTINLDSTSATAAWTQGLRYLYLVDFADWFSTRQLSFSVSLGGWENYDWNDVEGGGDGIVEILPN